VSDYDTYLSQGVIKYVLSMMIGRGVGV